VRSEETRVGTRIRIRSGYRIVKVWGAPHYAAVEVRLDDGRSELLWRSELEEVREAHQGVFTQLRWG
jgi:hypothetical protein